MDAELPRKIVTLALQRLRARAEQHTPLMAEEILAWINSLYPGHQPEDYWTDPEAFPLLATPWWLEHTLNPSLDSSLQPDLIYSSINMYCHIRLIDNLMDGDVPTSLNLLPALGFFHAEFLRLYHFHFDYKHPFWDFFCAIWFHSAEVTMIDANMSEFDAAQFINTAAQKTCAAKIPLAAVCYKYNRIDVLPAWSHFLDRLGCWSQMLNDVFDWLKDAQHRTATFFLSEATRRKHSTESVTEWVIREGFEWAMETLETWMSELMAIAKNLQSRGPVAYLDKRAAVLEKRRKDVHAGLRSLAKIRSALKCDS